MIMMNLGLGPEDPDEDEEDVVVNVDDGEEDDKAGKGDDKDGADAAEEDRPTRNANETDEQRRIRNREARHRAKENRRAAMQRKDAEIEALRNTVAQQNVRLQKVEERAGNQDLAQMDQAIRGAQHQIEREKALIKAARAAEDVDAETAAIDRLTDVKADLRQMEGFKESVAASERIKKERGGTVEDKQRGGEREEIKLTPEQQQRANETKRIIETNFGIFRARHPWYKTTGNDDKGQPDADSQVVLALDRAVAQEGFDPRTPEYWEELEDRIGERLPKRAVRTNGAPAMNGGGGRGNGGGGGDSQNGFRLSKARVEAMKESGAWDDPKRKKALIKHYQQYDEQQKSAQRGN